MFYLPNFFNKKSKNYLEAAKGNLFKAIFVLWDGN